MDVPDQVIALSGVNSDPDPLPGVSIARSIRAAFPHATLIAVDYSVRSSGLHHDVFNEIRVEPAWSDLDLDTYARRIREFLQHPSACWIPGLDQEIAWLARALPGEPRLLVPGHIAQRAIRKPAEAAAVALQMRVPDFHPANANGSDVHRLGRRSGWRLWVKGACHGARAVHSFEDLRRRVRELHAEWPLDDIFIQSHIVGHEHAIAFAASRGRLIEAVEIEKLTITDLGKTWAANVTPLAGDTRSRLAAFVHSVCWTGGGEIEFIRDEAGCDWLIDVNSRFPAYVHGATVCGTNLPAALVADVLDCTLERAEVRAGQFVRIVEERAVREAFPLPSIAPVVHAAASRLGSDVPHRTSGVPPLPLFVHGWRPQLHTPYRYRERDAPERRLDDLASVVARSAGPPGLVPALSIKTDPRRELATRFLRRGWWAEVISARELEWARLTGFSDSSIVFNGPAVAELSRRSETVRLGAAFADSVESFEGLLHARPADVIGFRVRPSQLPSRFGVDLSDVSVFTRVAHCLRHHRDVARLGMHMHYASDVCGPTRWLAFFDDVLKRAQALSQETGVGFSVVDIGGGWHPEDFDELLLPSLAARQAEIHLRLPTVRTLFLEPGKAICNDTAWLVTRIIEVRASSSTVQDVVVDGSIADLPLAAEQAHQILHLRDGRCLGWLGGGEQRILGVLCMEADILADGVSLPERPLVGDELLFSSAGGYNASMAWHFASGISRDSDD